MSSHIGDWVICDPTISKEGQHGAGSWVCRISKFTSIDTYCSGTLTQCDTSPLTRD